MQLETITPLILTYNEAANIDRTLACLAWASQIVVIDSFSTDDTLAMVQRYPQVQVYQRAFDSFAEQCNFGLTHITTPWTLSLDADYQVSPTLVNEIRALPENPLADGFRVPFEYGVFGKPLRGSAMPPRTVLYRTLKATYKNQGHSHHVSIDGTLDELHGVILHDDRKSFSRWLWSQNRYTNLEVQKLIELPENELDTWDRIRQRKIIAPFIMFFYCLIFKGGIFDGWRGWYYSFQRMLAEILISISLIELDYR
jgi:glycosyltransferase involved in cell wall biosynthesis